MLGLRQVLRWGWLCAASAVSLAACGGQKFSSLEAGGSGSLAGAGTGASGGAGGSTSESGNAGQDSSGGAPDSGSSGAAGTLSTGCSCPAGQYCRGGTKDCLDCAELSRLRFDTPERLQTLSASDRAARFPRVGETRTDLFYEIPDMGIRYTTDSSASAGSPVAQTLPSDRAPLLLSGGPMLSGVSAEPFNFAFDRLDQTTRQLYFGVWQDGLLAVSRAPAPYNGTESNDFSIAIASAAEDESVPRAFWMSDRDPMAGVTLLTAPLSAAPGEAVPVMLKVGPGACTPDAADLMPWLTRDAKTLLFSNTRVGDDCQPVAGQGNDLYTTLLQPGSGQPTAPALPLADVNGPGNDVDPSFSTDFCELYFASDRDGDYALYRARRR